MCFLLRSRFSRSCLVTEAAVCVYLFMVGEGNQDQLGSAPPLDPKMERHKRLSNIFTTALAFCSVVSAAPVEVKRLTDKVEIVIGGHPFTTYSFGNVVAKPYLMPLQTASGVIISRDFPVDNTITAEEEKSRYFEPHQRPLYFDHGNINGLSFWTEEAFAPYYHGQSKQAFGRMSLMKLEEAKGGPEDGVVRARFKLMDPSGRVIAEETQNFRFRGDDQTRIIDCEFVVDANHGPVTFGDTKEGTFGVRLRAELSAPHDHMTNSNGAQGEKAIWGKPADWVNYSGSVSGKPVSVAVFDSPKSFRHPTTWHARAYGLLSANPFGWREFSDDPNRDGSWTVPEGKSLTFRYRVVIHDGELSTSQLADMYREYSAGQ